MVDKGSRMADPSKIEAELRKEYGSILWDLIDKACVGCALVALADAVYAVTDDWEGAESIRDLARQYVGRDDYCGSCKAGLWDMERREADGLSRPWETHKPRVLAIDKILD